MAIERFYRRDGLYRQKRTCGWGSEKDVAAAAIEIMEGQMNKLQLRLQHYENSCNTILTGHGFPGKWCDLSSQDRETLPAQVKEAFDLKLMISMVRENVDENDAKSAAAEMAELVERFMVIEARQLTPLVARDQRREKGRIKGSKASKKRVGIMRAIEEEIAVNPSLTAKEIWNKLSRNTRDAPREVPGNYEVFFENDKLRQIDEDNKEQGLGYSAFEDYVTAAKKLREKS